MCEFNDGHQRVGAVTVALIQIVGRKYSLTAFNSNICARLKLIFFSLIRLMATLLPL